MWDERCWRVVCVCTIGAVASFLLTLPFLAMELAMGPEPPPWAGYGVAVGLGVTMACLVSGLLACLVNAALVGIYE